MEATQRLGLTYPSYLDKSWFSSFESMMSQIDSAFFAGVDARNVVFLGGGTIGWSSGQLSWSEDVVFVSPTFGQKETLSTAVSPVSVNSGYFAVVDLSRGPTTAVSLDASIASMSSVTIDNTKFVLGYHDPATSDFVLFNGVRIPDGESVSGGVSTSPNAAQSYVGVLVDNRGTPVTTGIATLGGGTVDFTVSALSECCSLQFVRVVSVSAASNLIDLVLYRDASRTEAVFTASAVDPSTQYASRNPVALIYDSGDGLENETIYGRITNNGASDSTFEIEVVVYGKQV